jgi:pyrroloquinoline quinone biosynthesis protein B
MGKKHALRSYLVGMRDFISIMIALCSAFIAPSIGQKPYIQVLGIAQDAGYPQAGCKKSCCAEVWKDPGSRARVSCVAVVIPEEKKYYLLDATPDIKDQMFDLERKGHELGGIFLSHAHIGHYTGLMHLGREAMGASNVPVFVMPRMKDFLKDHGPWSQLVALGNIKVMLLSEGDAVALEGGVSISAKLVPHRDEFSETVGFRISGPDSSGWFIPDIDKWEKWETPLEDLLQDDFILADGTFYRNGEIFGRDMSEIPHPFVEETMSRLADRSPKERDKVVFIHFNHTNPILWDKKIQEEVRHKGFRLAFRGMTLGL